MRFAIIGCAGYIARRHMDIIQKLGHRIVAAGAVVTRNVGSREMVIGIPARSIGLVDDRGRDL